MKKSVGKSKIIYLEKGIFIFLRALGVNFGKVYGVTRWMVVEMDFVVYFMGLLCKILRFRSVYKVF